MQGYYGNQTLRQICIVGRILLRDLVQKYAIRNKEEFLRMTEFIMDNVSNLLSPNDISDTFHRNSIEITRKTVSKYIEYLERSFLFYEAKRYDLKGKRYLKSNQEPDTKTMIIWE